MGREGWLPRRCMPKAMQQDALPPAESLAGAKKGAKMGEFFLNIALFISISETSIDLQEFSKVGQRRSRRMRQQQVASGGYD
jgi:hypothetical protein